jgi:hypothetical protein
MQMESGRTRRLAVAAAVVFLLAGGSCIANGVTARVVRDTVTEDGEIVEDTFDWYAQDRDGNVWYFGEDTAEFEAGEIVSRAGSFEAGVDGALPGIIMPADPRPGLSYRQEYYQGEAEDNGVVLSVDELADVPFGHYEDMLLTRDTNALERRASRISARPAHRRHRTARSTVGGPGTAVTPPCRATWIGAPRLLRPGCARASAEPRRRPWTSVAPPGATDVQGLRGRPPVGGYLTGDPEPGMVWLTVYTDWR